jgi:hypothetical protein
MSNIPSSLLQNPSSSNFPAEDRFRLQPERKEGPSILKVVQLGIEVIEVALSDGAQS